MSFLSVVFAGSIASLGTPHSVPIDRQVAGLRIDWQIETKRDDRILGKLPHKRSKHNRIATHLSPKLNSYERSQEIPRSNCRLNTNLILIGNTKMTLEASNGEPNCTTTNDSLVSSVRQFIHQQFPAARRRRIGDADSLLTQGIIDSLGVLEVVTFIESEFHLTITDDEMLSDHFESIARIVEFVAQKLAREESKWIP